ncbi:MAG: hypothetical protein M1438_03620 [Deltaproteobacteria bacterium]|nr:hypothetical protein [Deltaproteobacteria bacterium]
MRRGFLIIMIWFLAVMPAAAAGYDGETFELGGLKVAVWSAGGATAGRDGGRPSLRERLRQRLNGTPSAD